MRRRHFLRLVTLGSVTALVNGCGRGGATGGVGSGGAGPGSSVLSVARANGAGDFLRAVEAAGLTETLSGPGPFTVFAPSDRGFGGRSRFGDAEQARALVAYHVVPGTFTSDFLAGVDVNYTTLTGASLNVNGMDGLRVNGATVTRADLAASNGVVHIIDQVLAPK